MRIVLSTIASNKTTTVSVSGLVLTVDGQDIDLSVIPEGGEADTAEDSPIFTSEEVKAARDKVTIRYYYDSSRAEDHQSSDLADYTFDITDGKVPCPIKWKPVEQAEGAENV